MSGATEFRLRCDPRLVPLTQGFPYFAKKALKIRVLSERGWEWVPFEMNEEQMVVLRVIERDAAAGRGSRVIVLKSRKLGISTLVQGLQFYWCGFLPAQQAVVMAHIDEATQQLATIAEGMVAHLPPVLQDRFAPTRFGNKLTWPNGSTMRIATQGSDDRLRGSSPSALHMSEVGLWHKKRQGTTGNEPILAALGALESATELPTPGTLVVMESTACGSTGPFHARWYSAQGSSQWTPLFFPWQTAAKHQPAPQGGDLRFMDWLTTTPEEKRVQAWLAFAEVWETPWAKRRGLVAEWAKRAVEFSLTPAQVRWALGRCEDLGSIEVFDQEFPLSPEHAFMASGRPVLKPQDTGWIEEPESGVLRFGRLGKVDRAEVGAKALERLAALVPGDEWEVYALPEPGWRNRYVVSIDASGGSGQDYACIQVWDKLRGEQAAEFLSSTVSPSDLAVEARTIARLYHGALLAPEVNNHGHAVLAALWDAGERAIFRRQIRDRVNRAERADEASMQYGWETTPSTRTVMMEHVAEVCRAQSVRLYSHRLRHQLAALVRDRKDRIDHPPGGHDDCVTSLAVGLQVALSTPTPAREDADRLKAYKKQKAERKNEFLGARR